MDNRLFMDKLKAFESEIDNLHFLRVDEFPSIDLYIDQTVSFINKNLEVFNMFGEYCITKSMINNYVKHKIVPPPDGKKYTKKQVIIIYVVCFLKQVLRMDEIKSLVDVFITEAGNERAAYDIFANELESSFKNSISYITDDDEKDLDSDSFIVGNIGLKYTAQAIAYKLYAQKLISIISE